MYFLSVPPDKAEPPPELLFPSLSNLFPNAFPAPIKPQNIKPGKEMLAAEKKKSKQKDCVTEKGKKWI